MYLLPQRSHWKSITLKTFILKVSLFETLPVDAIVDEKLCDKSSKDCDADTKPKARTRPVKQPPQSYRHGR